MKKIKTYQDFLELTPKDYEELNIDDYSDEELFNVLQFSKKFQEECLKMKKSKITTEEINNLNISAKEFLKNVK